MTNNNINARISGLFYLALIITGMLSLMYIPSQLIDFKNPEATLQNIQNSEQLFRWGIVLSILSFLAFLGLVLSLYRLFQNVNKGYATVMVILVVVSLPLSFVNILNEFTILTLLKNSTLSTNELSEQVIFYLREYNNGINLAQTFWGLWLFPFGYLVYKSGFLPKFFGIMLMAGCFGYLIEFSGAFLVDGYKGSIFSTIAGIPATVGELGICLWLLIFGAKANPFKKASV